jgi:hypothetical protein
MDGFKMACIFAKVEFVRYASNMCIFSYIELELY